MTSLRRAHDYRAAASRNSDEFFGFEVKSILRRDDSRADGDRRAPTNDTGQWRVATPIGTTFMVTAHDRRTEAEFR